MKQRLLLVIFVYTLNTMFAQQQAKIDSLNSLTLQNSAISSDSLLKIFQLNLENSKVLEYDSGIAGSYWQLSTLHAYKGDLDISIDYMLKSIKVYEKIGDMEKVADGYGELGYRMKREDLDKAQEYMLKGKRIAEEHNYEMVMSRIYNNYGVIKEMKGQLDSAEFYYRKGLKKVLKIDFKTGIPYSYSSLAGILAQRGAYDSARYYFEQSRSLRIDIQDRKGIAENYTQIGEVYLEEGNPSSAIKSFRQAIPLALEENYNFLAQYTYQKMSEAFKFRNNTDSALFYLEKYNVFKDSINSIDVKEKIAELNVEFETEQKENEILAQRAKLAENELQLQKRNFIIAGILILTALLAVLAYLVIKRQKSEKIRLKKEGELQVAIAELDTRNKLEKQRLRISRDLHDNIGSQLTFIISSLDNLKYRLKDSDAIILKKIDQISTFTSTTINELRDTIWAMNKETITRNELQDRLKDLIYQAKQSSEMIDFELNFDPGLLKIEYSALDAINMYRIIQESLNNAIKYSEASTISVEEILNDSRIEFVIKDNGIGFDPEDTGIGFGLLNMQKRAKESNIDLEIWSRPGKGTRVTLQK